MTLAFGAALWAVAGFFAGIHHAKRATGTPAGDRLILAALAAGMAGTGLMALG